MTQTNMFDETQTDLPLFSGTAPRGKVEAFNPPPVGHQAAIAACRTCLDTGLVDGKKCWCAAAKRSKRQKLETGDWGVVAWRRGDQIELRHYIGHRRLAHKPLLVEAATWPPEPHDQHLMLLAKHRELGQAIVNPDEEIARLDRLVGAGRQAINELMTWPAA